MRTPRISPWAWRALALIALIAIALLYTRRDAIFDLANFIAACF
jgi:hypothetical protein